MVERMQLHMMSSGARTLSLLPEKFGSKHAAYGLTSDEWHVLRQDDCWNFDEAQRAAAALPKVFDGALMAAGIPPIPQSAEYVACCLATVIKPHNWMAAASRFRPLDGYRMAAPGGDVVSSREYVSSERLFALMLAYHEHMPPALVATDEERSTAAALKQAGDGGADA